MLLVGRSGGRGGQAVAAAAAAATAAALNSGRSRARRAALLVGRACSSHSGSHGGHGASCCPGEHDDCGDQQCDHGHSDCQHVHHHHHHHGAPTIHRRRWAGPLASPPLASLPSAAAAVDGSSSGGGGGSGGLRLLLSDIQHHQRRHKSSTASSMRVLPTYAPSSAHSGEPHTFVSKYYQIEVGDVLEFLHRKDLAFRETATHVIVRECPFCPKPTLGKADNEYKLYISKDGAAWFCHRCGQKGSWFDFKRRMGSNLLPPAPESDAEAWGLFSSSSPADAASTSFPSSNVSIRSYGPPSAAMLRGNGNLRPASASLRPGVRMQMQGQRMQQQPGQPQPVQREKKSLTEAVREYQHALMDDPAHRHVREWLTGSGEGQRGLSPTVLRKYGVGCGTFSFLNDRNEFEPAECVVFPWMVPAADPATATATASAAEGPVASTAGDKPPAAAAAAKKGKRRARGAAAAAEEEEEEELQAWVTKRCKIRAMKHKAWQRLHPTGAGWGLFGLHTVGPEAKEVVLTEGEFDAMAVYQATGRPAVSLPNGCRSLPVEVLPMLERFERVLLWMDADTPGVEGAEKFAHKLGAKRTFIVRPLPDEPDPPKDANEALLRGVDMQAMLRQAQRLPDNRIVRFADLRPLVFDELRNKDKYEGVRCKAFPNLMGLLKGFRKGEMTVLTGPTGAGKTTFLSQLSIDLASQGMNTLWGSFEVQNVRLVEKMLRQYHAAPLPMGDPKGLDAVADRFARLPLLFLRFHGSSNLDEVLDAMEYCAYVYDTGLVILDNLQFMMSMSGNGNGMQFRGGFDRFHQMDVAVERFRRFATEKNVHVMLVVHPRKESDQLRLGISSISGTAKATQDADNVLILQRHQGRHYLDLRKNRFDGDLGIVPLEFYKPTGTLKEVENSRLANLVHEEMVAGVAGGGATRYGAGGDPRNQPMVREKQFY